MAKLKQKIVMNKLPNITSAIRSAVEKVVNETADEIADIAQQLSPVKTGNLRDSIHVEPSKNGAKVEVDAEYASYVEFGTHNSAAQPFLRPAAESVKTRLNRRLGQIEKGLGKEINGIGNRNR